MSLVCSNKNVIYKKKSVTQIWRRNHSLLTASLEYKSYHRVVWPTSEARSLAFCSVFQSVITCGARVGVVPRLQDEVGPINQDSGSQASL